MLRFAGVTGSEVALASERGGVAGSEVALASERVRMLRFGGVAG